MCGSLLSGEEFKPGSLFKPKKVPFQAKQDLCWGWEKRGNGNSEQEELPSLHVSEGNGYFKGKFCILEVEENLETLLPSPHPLLNLEVDWVKSRSPRPVTVSGPQVTRATSPSTPHPHTTLSCLHPSAPRFAPKRVYSCWHGWTNLNPMMKMVTQEEAKR